MLSTEYTHTHIHTDTHSCATSTRPLLCINYIVVVRFFCYSVFIVVVTSPIAMTNVNYLSGAVWHATHAVNALRNMRDMHAYITGDGSRAAGSCALALFDVTN